MRPTGATPVGRGVAVATRVGEGDAACGKVADEAGRVDEGFGERLHGELGDRRDDAREGRQVGGGDLVGHVAVRSFAELARLVGVPLA